MHRLLHKNISNCNLLILPIVPYQGELTLYHLRLNIQESENKESIVPFSYCPQDALKSVPLGRLNLKQQAVFILQQVLKPVSKR